MKSARSASPSLARLLVPRDATLLQAMAAINDGGHAIAFVTDERARVVGTLTDGDIRRTVLTGASLESRNLRRAMNRAFTSVGPGSGRVEVLDMMRARGITQVPVLDGAGRLVGLHLMHELIGAIERPNWAVIMAGGRGERLRPLTETVPKPMLPVAGRPIIERLVLHLVGAGIRRVFVSVNYLGHVIKRHFKDGRRFGCSIEYLRESKPLGTGGPLSLLPNRPKYPILVLNGDLVTHVNISDMLRFHDEGNFGITIGTRSHEVSVPFGVVDVRGRRVIGLREKPTEPVLINTGVYVIAPRVVRLVPPRAYPITDLVHQCFRRRLSVGAYYIQDDWQDIGRPDDLRRARGEL